MISDIHYHVDKFKFFIWLCMKSPFYEEFSLMIIMTSTQI